MAHSARDVYSNHIFSWDSDMLCVLFCLIFFRSACSVENYLSKFYAYFNIDYVLHALM